MAGRLKALRDRFRGSFCERELGAGDVVQVPGATWDEIEHPVGGRGRWATFIGKKGTSAIVRPLSASLIPGDPQTVPKVMHIDDVVNSVALREYYQRRAPVKK